MGWPRDLEKHYAKDKVIGLGSFGTVHLGIDRKTGKEVAIKIMPKQRGSQSSESTLNKIGKEVEVLAQLQGCPAAVRLLGCYETDDDVALVTELCNGGDLQQLSEDCGQLPERVVALVAYEVLKIVAACHEVNVLHGDIKPANFIMRTRKENPLGSPGDPRYAAAPWLAAIDLGCAQTLDPDHPARMCGTPTYMAPELFGKEFHLAADMWSVGVMLYQLYAYQSPEWAAYEACRSKVQEQGGQEKLDRDAPLPLDRGRWLEMSREGVAFMHGCLARDWSKRISAQEALMHPWFDKWIAGHSSARASAAASAPPRGAAPPRSNGAFNSFSSFDAADAAGPAAAGPAAAASAQTAWAPAAAPGPQRYAGDGVTAAPGTPVTPVHQYQGDGAGAAVPRQNAPPPPPPPSSAPPRQRQQQQRGGGGGASFSTASPPPPAQQPPPPRWEGDGVSYRPPPRTSTLWGDGMGAPVETEHAPHIVSSPPPHMSGTPPPAASARASSFEWEPPTDFIPVKAKVLPRGSPLQGDGMGAPGESEHAPHIVSSPPPHMSASPPPAASARASSFEWEPPADFTAIRERAAAPPRQQWIGNGAGAPGGAAEPRAPAAGFGAASGGAPTGGLPHVIDVEPISVTTTPLQGDGVAFEEAAPRQPPGGAATYEGDGAGRPLDPSHAPHVVNRPPPHMMGEEPEQQGVPVAAMRPRAGTSFGE